MIIGIGADLVDIKRISHLCDRFGTMLDKKLFTDQEVYYAQKVQSRYAASLAKCFSAKEACAKALGTGIGSAAGWKDISVMRNKKGKPELIITGRAQMTLLQMMPRFHHPKLHLALSDDGAYAQGFVVIEALISSSQA